VHPAGTVIVPDRDDIRWCTWAGFKANATLEATLSDLADSKQRFTDAYIRMRSDLTLDMWKAATADAAPDLWASFRVRIGAFNRYQGREAQGQLQ
jgi:ATP-dependent helicase Lhr and Lhr-like helicase